MTSLRHLALGCCVISALAGMLRLFWPENSFKTVINAVLVLYILTAGVQMVAALIGTAWPTSCATCPQGAVPPTMKPTAGNWR